MLTVLPSPSLVSFFEKNPIVIGVLNPTNEIPVNFGMKTRTYKRLDLTSTQGSLQHDESFTTVGEEKIS